MNLLHRIALSLTLAWALPSSYTSALQTPIVNETPKTLDQTSPLTMQGDIASQLVDGVDRFLINKLEQSISQRTNGWPKPGGSRLYTEATESLREDLMRRIGMKDQRIASSKFSIDAPNMAQNWVSKDEEYITYQIRWPIFDGVEAEGLLVYPNKSPVEFMAVLIPDADQSPEQVVKESVAISLIAAKGGCVVVPSVIQRHREARRGRAHLTDQEYLYRSAFALGRHILGYQVLESLGAVDILRSMFPGKSVIVAGWGEGGWIAIHTAAVDRRIDAAIVSGHFGPRESVWMEPIHRNVHGLLTSFGDAQLGALIAPRHLVIDSLVGPKVNIPGDGGAPGKLDGPTEADAKRESEIAQSILKEWGLSDRVHFVPPQSQVLLHEPSCLSWNVALDALRLGQLNCDAGPKSASPVAPATKTQTWIEDSSTTTVQRRMRTLQKWDRYNQRLLETVASERDDYWKKLNTSKPDDFAKSVEPYREAFRNEVIGAWDDKFLPPNPKTKLAYEKGNWIGYEVVLDVFPDVIAYGVLLLPRDLKANEKRPVVVFQHGLEGRPKDAIEGDHQAYHDVASQLAEKGYIVFAPQNLYIFQDRFRTLQRKSNPLGKTLFSTMVSQHQQIVNWLATLPYVDEKHIAFYGLSYGGKSAMRIPALVPQYSLSICSADFNDWVWKNASTQSNYSYVWTGEYEIFEFDLGPKFNYAEMATLIAPRPFMVERGHFDGVAPDERVGLEFAKVQRLYSARLGLQERCRIEWFNGPHTINGKGTFQFLKEHLGR